MTLYGTRSRTETGTRVILAKGIPQLSGLSIIFHGMLLLIMRRQLEDELIIEFLDEIINFGGGHLPYDMQGSNGLQRLKQLLVLIDGKSDCHADILVTNNMLPQQIVKPRTPFNL